MENRGQDDVALVRVEQLYPFPREALSAELARFKQATSVIWCQEEPQNQGAWYQIRHHLQHCVPSNLELHYAGRQRSPSPAVGLFSKHVAEQQKLVDDALASPVGSVFAAD